MAALELVVTAGEVLVREHPGNRSGVDGKVVSRIALSRPYALPILKWAGGKQWLAKIVNSLVPMDNWRRYYEPFLGGGSVFFALNTKSSVLADINPHLIATYSAVAHDVDAVIAELARYVAEKWFYDDLKSRRPRSRVKVAARMLYLNKTAWNGLYRVNRIGQFNVPFGRFDHPTICHEDRLRAAAEALLGAQLRIGDFEGTVRRAREDDLVYFDPPYTCSHGTNGFLKYNAKLFSWSDQIRLADVANRLKRRGVHVIVSNAGHPEIAQLYDKNNFISYRVERNSLIGGSGDWRGRVSEVLFSSFPFELGKRPATRD